MFLLGYRNTLVVPASQLIIILQHVFHICFAECSAFGQGLFMKPSGQPVIFGFESFPNIKLSRHRGYLRSYCTQLLFSSCAACDQLQNFYQFLPAVKISIETAEGQGIKNVESVLIVDQHFGLVLDLIWSNKASEFRFIKSCTQMAGTSGCSPKCKPHSF